MSSSFRHIGMKNRPRRMCKGEEKIPASVISLKRYRLSPSIVMDIIYSRV